VSVVRAAGRATTTIPIVFVTVDADPAADGLVASLARPGGNMTGLTLYAGQENAKRLELLKETSPGLSRVAILWRQSGVGSFRETEAAAQTLGVPFLPLEFVSPDELETVLVGATTGRADGLVVTAGAFSTLAPRIVEWVAGHRLPAIYPSSSFADYGGLMMYSASMTENWRRAAGYIDKILKGANPGDLPVERPTTFDFVVNLKTARALGLTIPPSVLQQATEVIQ
jgi:putative ABC transport system substrate-binding protein